MRIAVYCGASLGYDERYQQATIELANWLVSEQHQLVYGGGRVGLMGLLADTVLAKGGEVIGVLPHFLQQRELAHQHLTELILVDTMVQRKAKMLSLSEVCIALPGGPGTLEEISEVYSWARIGQNRNPCILFNVNGFYDPLKAMYQTMCEAGFLTEQDFNKLLFSDNFTELSDFIKNYQPPKVRTY